MEVSRIHARRTAAHEVHACRVEDVMLESRIPSLNSTGEEGFSRVQHGRGTSVATMAQTVLSAVALLFTFSCVGQSEVTGRVQGASGNSGAEVAPAVAVSAPTASGPRVSAPANRSRIALGRAIFFDPALSEPPGTSCASCHTPEKAFSGNHGSSIGVARGSRPDHFARRNTPSLLYLRYVPRFHFYADDDAF